MQEDEGKWRIEEGCRVEWLDISNHQKGQATSAVASGTRIN